MTRLTLTIDRKAYDIPDRAVPELQAACDRTNAANKTALTLGDWLVLTLKELAVAPALTAAIVQLQQQHEQDANAALQAAVTAARDQLIASLNSTAAAGGQPG